MRTSKLALILLPLALAGCWGQKSEFMTACAESGMDKDLCGCTYSIAEDALSKKELDLFVIMSVDGRRALNEATQSLGVPEGLALAANLAEVARRTGKECLA